MNQAPLKLTSTTLSITIDRDWRQLYDRFWRPEEFRWASGLCDASLKHIDGEWRANGPEGPITVNLQWP
jgi:hypothetical protein